MNSDTVLMQKKDSPWLKTRHMNHKPWKSIHGFDLGACPRKKYGITK